MLTGAGVNLMLERDQIADVFCDEDGQNWGTVVSTLGEGEEGDW